MGTLSTWLFLTLLLRAALFLLPLEPLLTNSLAMGEGAFLGAVRLVFEGLIADTTFIELRWGTP